MAFLGECHAHLFMNGTDYKMAVKTHRGSPDLSVIKRELDAYRERGISYIRDGGDHFGVCLAAREPALEAGIELRTPAFAIYKEGHYGRVVGKSFSSMKEFHLRVLEAASLGADFIKIMTSGIMDFSRPGCLSEEALPAEEVFEMVHIAHEEGFSVMSHTNGAQAVREAAEAGVDSIEHGAYLDREALLVMAEKKTIWLPTLSAVGNLLRSDRYPRESVQRILSLFAERIRLAADLGVTIAPGSDAGAFGVLHGQGLLDELKGMGEILGEGAQERMREGFLAVQGRFKRD